MQLSKQTLKYIPAQLLPVVPDEKIFSLPEKVLQFGTGVLLRGLPDYFIDKANRQGIFNGRVVIVKSTSNGGTDSFNKQDGLYTICVNGMEDGKKIEEVIINSSVSRVLSAAEDWDSILACAHNPSLQVIISNTTEVGITLTDDDIHSTPPHSFPGKLLAFLYERYKVFKGSAESGMVIIPTELITDNGTRLRSICIELAVKNKSEKGFIHWIETANHFCNSLVDRIVPGRLLGDDLVRTEEKLGYTDELMIMAESFRLWAIESGSERVKEILSFASSDDGIIIAANIEKFRELKLRLLNGTHTFSCGLSYLAGFTIVRETMENGYMSAFIKNLAIKEIAEAMTDRTISYAEACSFAAKVIDRFLNPYINHQWLSISVQYSSKMRMRNIPVLLKHYVKTDEPPAYMALGFAAFLLFMKCTRNNKGQFEGSSNGAGYIIQDEHAAWFAEKWQTNDPDKVVDTILKDAGFWGADLSQLNGFCETVKLNLRSLINNGVKETVQDLLLKKAVN